MKFSILTASLTASLLTLATFAAAAADHFPARAYITTTIVMPTQPGSDSKELAGGSVVTTTRKVIRATSMNLSRVADLNLDDTLPPGGLLPDGVSLPDGGVPGQTVTIDTCVPHRSTTVYEFKWIFSPPSGHWLVVKKALTEVESTQCT